MCTDAGRSFVVLLWILWSARHCLVAHFNNRKALLVVLFFLDVVNVHTVHIHFRSQPFWRASALAKISDVSSVPDLCTACLHQDSRYPHQERKRIKVDLASTSPLQCAKGH